MKFHGWFKPQHDFQYAKRALKAGLHGFEITGGESHYDPEEFKRYRANIERIKDELQASFTLHAPITDINLGSINRRIRQASLEDVQAALEFAREIGASAVALHASPGMLAMPGGKWSQETKSPPIQAELVQQEELLIESVRKLADGAADLILGLENLVYPHELYRSPEEVAGLVGKIGRPNVGITLDVGHAVVSGYDPLSFVHRLSERIVHVHLHDNSGTVDEHLPLGQGSINYKRVIRALEQASYQGVVALEFILADPDDYRPYLEEFARVVEDVQES